MVEDLLIGIMLLHFIKPGQFVSGLVILPGEFDKGQVDIGDVPFQDRHLEGFRHSVQDIIVFVISHAL